MGISSATCKLFDKLESHTNHLVHIIVLIGAEAANKRYLIELVRFGGVTLIEHLGILGRDRVIGLLADRIIFGEFFDDGGAVDSLAGDMLGLDAASVGDGLTGVIDLDARLEDRGQGTGIMHQGCLLTPDS